MPLPRRDSDIYFESINNKILNGTLSKITAMDKTHRERQRYRSSWEADPIFQNWLRPSVVSHRAYCSHCQCEIAARHSDILRHSRTSKHLKALEYIGLFSEAENMCEDDHQTLKVTNGKAKRRPKAKSKKRSRPKSAIDEPPIQEVSDFIISAIPDEEDEHHTAYHEYDNFVGPDIVPPKTEDCDSKLLSTLCEIDPNNYNYLYKRCKDFNVKYHQLPYLKPEHIRELIPKTQLGIMAEFEYMLYKWIDAKGYLNGGI